MSDDLTEIPPAEEWPGKRLPSMPVGPKNQGMVINDTDTGAWLRSDTTMEIRQ